MKPILTLLLFLITYTAFAGGISASSQRISYKVISYRDGKKKVSNAFIRRANMMIVLTLGPNRELIYMDNRWVNFHSSSYGELVKTTYSNKYLWKPTNTYNKERNTCIVTTYEVIKKGKSIRTFDININQGKEKLVIVAERMQVN